MLHQIETASVLSYDLGTSQIEKAFYYPGLRPEGSYITDGEMVQILPDTYDSFVDTANEFLHSRNVPGMVDRIPVLSYGANAAPHLLSKKMSKFAVAEEIRDELQIVPLCKVTMPDTIAAWHGRPGQNGSAFAELVKSQSTNGTDLQAHVAYMTTEQLAILSITEGVTYSLAEVEVLAGEDKVPIIVLAYVALDSSLRIVDESPVAVRGIIHKGKVIQSASAEEVVADMLVDAEYPIEGPLEFAEEALEMTLAQKKARQEVIGKSLDSRGSRIAYRYPVNEGELIGRVDFSSAKSISSTAHHELHTIPEMELSRIRPGKSVVDDKVEQLRVKNVTLTEQELVIKALRLIDPARLISQRAHDEIEQRLKTAIDKYNYSSIMRRR